MADLRYEHHGSIGLLHADTPAGKEWLEERTLWEEWAWWGDALAVEPRYVGDILRGAQNDGLEVSA